MGRSVAYPLPDPRRIGGASMIRAMRLTKCLDCGDTGYRSIGEDEIVYCRKCVPVAPKDGTIPKTGNLSWRSVA